MEKADRSKVGRKSKRKGSSNELQLAKLLQEWYGGGFTMARTPGSGGWQTQAGRAGFAAHGDLMSSDPDFNFVIEAKKVEGWDLAQIICNPGNIVMKWWKQTLEETPLGKIPILIFGKNNTERLVMMRHSDLPPLCGIVPTFNLEWPGELHLIIMSISNFLKLPRESFPKDGDNFRPDWNEYEKAEK